MSNYTTGEIAKLCDVSVRTVQYYDTRGILAPSTLSEGGRRLYSEGDLQKMRTICFLRSMGFSINNISLLFEEECPDKVIEMLLDQQEHTIRQEMDESKSKLESIAQVRRAIKHTDSLSVESIADIAHTMDNKKKLKKMRITMLLTGIPVTALQWGSIIWWVTSGVWWLFAVWAAVAAVWGTVISKYYFSHVAYICPKCNQVFVPKFWNAFWANHTPNTRKLTCPHCSHKGFCVETYRNA